MLQSHEPLRGAYRKTDAFHKLIIIQKENNAKNTHSYLIFKDDSLEFVVSLALYEKIEPLRPDHGINLFFDAALSRFHETT